ncbi:hypothetical protein [Micromonospora aurantiaca]|uniref:hypothetical protein n=1 Tax=Micromonospora aurantiaca (nom. illeg.) TaxID=47850 RepID=UPI001F07747B|nr:hypothetical protein [Micromonospora aurantiaca]
MESVPGLVEALEGDLTEPSPWLDAELADLAEVLPAGFGRPGTVLISPMPSAGGPAGALVLARRRERPGFDKREIGLAREFAGRAGAALAAAELYGEQAHLARVLQNSLLPPALPRLPGMTLAGGYRAAGDSLRIGGDFYDLFPTGDGPVRARRRLGKGVGAAAAADAAGSASRAVAARPAPGRAASPGTAGAAQPGAAGRSRRGPPGPVHHAPARRAAP